MMGALRYEREAIYLDCSLILFPSKLDGYIYTACLGS